MSEFELYTRHKNYEAAEETGLQLIQDFVEKARVGGHLDTPEQANSFANDVINGLEGHASHDPLVETFVTQAREWQKTNRACGADDTASREAFILSVARSINGE